MGFLRTILVQISKGKNSLITDMAVDIVKFSAGKKIDLFYVDYALIMHQYDYAKVLRRLLS